MTQAVNLANFANSLDSSGGVSPSSLNSQVPISKGGTGATTAAAARTNLGVDYLNTFNLIYPIGSIYINATVSTNPAILFGFGTWEEFGTGRVLIGQNTANPAFDELGEIGGSNTTAETAPGITASSTSLSIPTSGFTVTGSNPGTSPNGYALYGTGRWEIGETLESVSWTNGNDRSIGSHTHVISNTGHTHSFPPPPYIIVIMWKRTA